MKIARIALDNDKPAAALTGMGEGSFHNYVSGICPVCNQKIPMGVAMCDNCPSSGPIVDRVNELKQESAALRSQLAEARGNTQAMESYKVLLKRCDTAERDLVTVREELADARHELGCSNDVILDLTVGIATAREKLQLLEKKLTTAQYDAYSIDRKRDAELATAQARIARLRRWLINLGIDNGEIGRKLRDAEQVLAEPPSGERSRIEEAYQIAISALSYLGRNGDTYAKQEAERAEAFLRG